MNITPPPLIFIHYSIRISSKKNFKLRTPTLVTGWLPLFCRLILFQGTKPLLLHSLISQDTDRKTEKDKQTDTTEDSGPPKTKKRKHMSTVEREIADKERERAIMAYRLMRKQRLQGKKESV